jgi:sarcosine oxidase subunit gamma
VTADTLRRSPLGHLADVFTEHSIAGERGVRLRELPFLAQLDIQLQPHGTAAQRLGRVLGTPLPTGPNTVTQAGHHRVLWLGPEEWLVVGPDGSAHATAELLRAALEDEPGSVVDVSANRTTLELAGPAAREVLEKGCALDLHPRTFGPGACAQTLLARVNVILHQVDAEPCYRLLVRGSFAPYLSDWLLDAMEEYRHAPLAP